MAHPSITQKLILASNLQHVISEPIRRLAEAEMPVGAVATDDRGTDEPDRQALLACVDGDANLLRELIDLALVDGPRALAHIRQGLDTGDVAAVYRSAHTLRGAMSNFGAGTIVALLTTLEEHARDGNVRDCIAEFASAEPRVLRFLSWLAGQREGLPCAAS